MKNSEMLDSIRFYKKFSTKKAFADYLGIRANVLSNWYSRNTFDEFTILSKIPEINRVWLLTGEGEMLDHPHNEATHNINSSNNTYINGVGDNSQEKTNEKNIYNEMIITQRELIDSLKEQIIQYRKEIEYLKKKIKDCNENNGK